MVAIRICSPYTIITLHFRKEIWKSFWDQSMMIHYDTKSNMLSPPLPPIHSHASIRPFQKNLLGLFDTSHFTIGISQQKRRHITQILNHL